MNPKQLKEQELNKIPINEKDFVDVMQMVRRDVIELPQLKQYYEEVLPELEGMLQSDPDDFVRKFALFEKRLAEESS